MIAISSTRRRLTLPADRQEFLADLLPLPLGHRRFSSLRYDGSFASAFSQTRARRLRSSGEFTAATDIERFLFDFGVRCPVSTFRELRAEDELFSHFSLSFLSSFCLRRFIRNALMQFRGWRSVTFKREQWDLFLGLQFA